MEVTHYRSAEGNGPTIAYVCFKIPEWGLHLNGCSLIRARSGGRFISFPSKKYQKDGEDKYAPYFGFDRLVGERFQKTAKAAIDEWVKQREIE